MKNDAQLFKNILELLLQGSNFQSFQKRIKLSQNIKNLLTTSHQVLDSFTPEKIALNLEMFLLETPLTEAEKQNLNNNMRLLNLNNPFFNLLKEQIENICDKYKKDDNKKKQKSFESHSSFIEMALNYLTVPQENITNEFAFALTNKLLFKSQLIDFIKCISKFSEQERTNTLSNIQTMININNNKEFKNKLLIIKNAVLIANYLAYVYKRVLSSEQNKDIFNITLDPKVLKDNSQINTFLVAQEKVLLNIISPINEQIKKLEEPKKSFFYRFSLFRFFFRKNDKEIAELKSQRTQFVDSFIDKIIHGVIETHNLFPQSDPAVTDTKNTRTRTSQQTSPLVNSSQTFLGSQNKKSAFSDVKAVDSRIVEIGSQNMCEFR